MAAESLPPAMEPISALEVAAAVVQFVEFATKRLRDVQKLYETGDSSLLKSTSFEHVARDLVGFAADFQQTQRLGPAWHDRYGRVDSLSVPGSASRYTANTSNLQAIDELIAYCSGAAHEMAKTFQRLDEIRQSGHSASKIVASMKAACTHDDITRLVGILATYRSQLVLRMLKHLSVMTDDVSEAQRQQLDYRHQQHPKVVQVLAVTKSRLHNVESQDNTLGHHSGEMDASGIVRHDKVLSAILILQDNEARVIVPTGIYERSPEGQTQSLMTLKAGDDGTVGYAELAGFEPIQEMVLRSLYFRRYSDRYDSVKPAHAATFNWTLEDTSDLERPWSSLVRWLKRESGIYWINGKAGSGKSTLMKYLLNDPRMRTALRTWAGSSQDEVTRASFFFWSLGSTVQKSQEGLLRSLLYDILSQHPGLIPCVMPERRILGVDPSQRNILEAPSFSELLRWFRRLLDQASHRFRLFFLIDGVDEYEGDQAEVVNLLTSVATYPDVKFLISSRQLPVCVDAFSRFPNLRLQDLTRNDIRSYTRELLVERMGSINGLEWENFVEEIVDKSGGVFLWVVLVVRSLLSITENLDGVHELRHRLDQFPSDVGELYAAMFRYMQPAFQKQASELFQLCLMATEAQNGKFHLTPIQLHFAGWNIDSTAEMPVKVLSIADEKTMVDQMEARIQARCAGILELRSINFRFQGLFSSNAVKHYYVDFVHRTAVEFLRLPEVWDEVCRLTAGSGFHPAVGLCHSCVLLCKTSAKESPLVLDESEMWYYMDRAMHYASLAQRDGTPVSPRVLLALDNTMAMHWRDVDNCYITQEVADVTKRSLSERRRYQGVAFCSTKTTHWASGHDLRWEEERLAGDDGPPLRSCLLGAAKPLDFYSLAVFYCLTDFLQQMIPHFTAPGAQSNDLASRLLFDAANNMLFRRPWAGTAEHKEAMALACPPICGLLLDQGADPNTQFGISRESSWQLMLEYGLTHQARKAEFWRNYDFRGFAYTYSRLMVNFVLHGADVNAEAVSKQRRSIDFRSYRPTYSALAAVEALYSPYDSMDPFSYGAHASAAAGTRSEELVLFYEHLVLLMNQNGAVKDLGDRDRTSQGAMSRGNRYSGSALLAPPGVPPRPKSADAVKNKLKGMFGKWHNPKGSVET